jgi:hypothetical protein
MSTVMMSQSTSCVLSISTLQELRAITIMDMKIGGGASIAVLAAALAGATVPVM